MSFTLTYRDLANPHLLSGVRKLAQSAKWREPRDAYNVMKIHRLLASELKLFNDLRCKFQEKWKDTPSGDVDMQDEADKFADIEVVIDCHKVSFAVLSEMALTPLELGALEPLLTDLPI